MFPEIMRALAGFFVVVVAVNSRKEGHNIQQIQVVMLPINRRRAI